MIAPILENERVKLSPLKLEHAELLLPIASQDKLVQYSPSDITTPVTLNTYIATALKHLEELSAIPFIIFDKQMKAYAGSTRFMNIHWPNKVLHIGSTWIGREFQGTGLNPEVKKLMLSYAFIDLNFEKVEFRGNIKKECLFIRWL